MHHSRMRFAPCILLALSTASFAQPVADPGRRLTPEEIRRLDSETQSAPQGEAVPPKPANRPRDPALCDRARTNYTLMCRAPNSRQSYSRECAEANDIYERACRP